MKILFYAILSNFLIFLSISKATIVDDVLLIPMTETMPVIDGQLVPA